MKLFTSDVFLLICLMFGQTLGSDPKTELKCERRLPDHFFIQNLELTCYSPDVIHILAGNFGRQDTTACPEPTLDTETLCEIESTFDKIFDTCDGQTTCELLPTVEFFALGDTCNGTYKYINVTYQCAPKTTTTVSTTTTPTPTTTMSTPTTTTSTPTTPTTTTEISTAETKVTSTTKLHIGNVIGKNNTVANQNVLVQVTECRCELEQRLGSFDDPLLTTFSGDTKMIPLEFVPGQKRATINFVTSETGDEDPCKFEIEITLKKHSKGLQFNFIDFRFGIGQNVKQYAKDVTYIKKTHRLVERDGDKPRSNGKSYQLAKEVYEYKSEQATISMTGLPEVRGLKAFSPECLWIVEYTPTPGKDFLYLSLASRNVSGSCVSLK